MVGVTPAAAPRTGLVLVASEVAGLDAAGARGAVLTQRLTIGITDERRTVADIWR